MVFNSKCHGFHGFQFKMSIIRGFHWGRCFSWRLHDFSSEPLYIQFVHRSYFLHSLRFWTGFYPQNEVVQKLLISRTVQNAHNYICSVRSRCRRTRNSPGIRTFWFFFSTFSIVFQPFSMRGVINQSINQSFLPSSEVLSCCNQQTCIGCRPCEV